MRTLITGGAGFIGINLAKKILETGEDVVVVDNFFRPGTLQNFKWLEERTRQDTNAIVEEVVALRKDVNALKGYPLAEYGEGIL